MSEKVERAAENAIQVLKIADKLAKALRGLVNQKRAPGIEEWMTANAVLREWDELQR